LAVNGEVEGAGRRERRAVIDFQTDNGVGSLLYTCGVLAIYALIPYAVIYCILWLVSDGRPGWGSSYTQRHAYHNDPALAQQPRWLRNQPTGAPPPADPPAPPVPPATLPEAVPTRVSVADHLGSLRAGAPWLTIYQHPAEPHEAPVDGDGSPP
jgi:hypothetical protein